MPLRDRLRSLGSSRRDYTSSLSLARVMSRYEKVKIRKVTVAACTDTIAYISI